MKFQFITGRAADSLTADQRDRLEKVVTLLQPEAADIVASAPAHPVTQNNYGHWMNYLSAFKSDQRTAQICLCEALVQAGAPAAGVQSALTIVAG